MESKELQSKIESALFVSGDPISLSKLSKITEAETSFVKESIELLKERYAQAESGLQLIEKKDLYQLTSKPENAPVVEMLVKSELQDSLSAAAVEVLSIIAYRGPISKAEIEAIRGVNCSYTLRNLLMRGLIDRSDNPRDQRGYVYNISFEFLKKLGIDAVEKLPQYDILSVDERIETINQLGHE